MKNLKKADSLIKHLTKYDYNLGHKIALILYYSGATSIVHTYNLCAGRRKPEDVLLNKNSIRVKPYLNGFETIHTVCNNLLFCLLHKLDIKFCGGANPPEFDIQSLDKVSSGSMQACSSEKNKDFIFQEIVMNFNCLRRGRFR